MRLAVHAAQLFDASLRVRRWKEIIRCSLSEVLWFSNVRKFTRIEETAGCAAGRARLAVRVQLRPRAKRSGAGQLLFKEKKSRLSKAKMLEDGKTKGGRCKDLMSPPVWAAAASAMLIASSLPGAAAEFRNTSTLGTACRQTNQGENRKATCAGPAEYSALITRRDDVFRISFGRLSDAIFHLEPEDSTLMWRGVAPFLGNRIEWQLMRGKPVTAIVRIFTVNPNGRPMQQFLIAKVTSTGGCEIARIDASDPGAFRSAHHIAASQVNNVMCELG